MTLHGCPRFAGGLAGGACRRARGRRCARSDVPRSSDRAPLGRVFPAPRPLWPLLFPLHSTQNWIRAPSAVFSRCTGGVIRVGGFSSSGNAGAGTRMAISATRSGSRSYGSSGWLAVSFAWMRRPTAWLPRVRCRCRAWATLSEAADGRDGLWFGPSCEELGFLLELRSRLVLPILSSDGKAPSLCITPCFEETGWCQSDRHDPAVELPVVVCLSFGRRDVADGLEQAPTLELVRPFEHCQLERFAALPRCAAVGQLGIVQPDDRLGQR